MVGRQTSLSLSVLGCRPGGGWPRACNSRSSRLRTESTAPLGRPGWNAMWGRQFGMPTAHPAGCIGRGQGVAMCSCHGLISRAFFVLMGEEAFIWEVQSTVHKLPRLILTLISILLCN